MLKASSNEFRGLFFINLRLNFSFNSVTFVQMAITFGKIS